jgi:peptide/nickel transport system permease protein
VIILALVAVSGYALIAIPPAKAVELWREQDPARYQVPAKAQPVWTNLWRREKLPPTIVLDSGGGRAEKLVGPFVQGTGHITLTYIVDYPYGGFPRNVLLHFRTRYAAKKPFATLTWLTSDGREFDLGRFAVGADQVYDASKDMPQKYFTRDTRMEGLLQGVGGNPASQVLFADPSSATPVAVKGRYALRASVLTFEPGTDVDADLLVEGQVYGMAGTDDKRRDLSVALLWGAPVALAFGLLGAVATSLISMLIAGTGAWFGGWLDGLVQRITEVNMLLPVLPMAMMVFYLYSASIWGVLGVLVLLGIFGSSIKSYRSLFLQIREAPYIEAAQAYGAGHGRIIARYLVPRMVPLLIPQLVILVPTYVCFEATLAFLGVSDPKLPTWGKLIYDAVTHGSVQAQPYWVLEPTMLIVATALAFAMLGYALDSILNPRLRSV